ncbi:MAG: Methyltransferase [Candidatus Falkowbacteria bacterium GW2011_GWC2_38_22]|uniref:Methyltransferase n=1 Tax=Candidatus Falkowbacteria bacterium GW2011_GWE1_38_31 TaxID=1618638 RepID=A0A0G0K734_9BACT|nr:MAG: Methyltransferase [Candidatus Falkowbacteria bacterium GW2011_GWF2_38_1205]KKQ61856.1 MAG: Methyltransferase [Candidatus Falkowbacteria bacterium GW2011_GWC2_38_22]KKQ64164.1 MAG: Methyltransferase [Candidatus Falkowbacteria bacterium GW2011_GWF1_38_22]KKQ66486.1 MAG: Methyltransferase [Candidatus Falkowbacteria bacterium GW2011_GWE2_38_254]KKQ71270.1 MAG: Methyltransferase [Candidatus Falkowbacteria bacterium GW2011_GWE1_38_31]KKQ73398.1 MAG: Methyltransferase [Candidatus Falkowbacter
MGEYKERTKQYYDSFANTWDKRFDNKSKSFLYFLNKRLKMLEKYLGDYDNLVDAGCGTGYYITNLLKNGKKGIGFDISPKMIEQAKKIKNERYSDKDISYVVDDGENLKFENDTFDRAICVGYLIHLEKQQKALNEIFRILKPGGKMVGLISNRWSPWLFLNLRKKFAKDYGVIQGDQELSPREVKKMMKESGFRNVEIKMFNTLPGKLPNWLYYPARILNCVFLIFPFSLLGWHILVVGEK